MEPVPIQLAAHVRSLVNCAAGISCRMDDMHNEILHGIIYMGIFDYQLRDAVEASWDGVGMPGME
jgi:hypothetical protein